MWTITTEVPLGNDLNPCRLVGRCDEIHAAGFIMLTIIQDKQRGKGRTVIDCKILRVGKVNEHRYDTNETFLSYWWAGASVLKRSLKCV